MRLADVVSGDVQLERLRLDPAEVLVLTIRDEEFDFDQLGNLIRLLPKGTVLLCLAGGAVLASAEVAELEDALDEARRRGEGAEE